MGLSASKRVSQAVRDSSDFDSACNSVYEECVSLTQHAFPGIRPYQLHDAADRLFHSLSTVHHPLITKWVPTPPTRGQVDKVLRTVTYQFKPVEKEEITLGSVEFKAFAVELFTDAIVSNAGKALLQRVPIGVVGIAGIGVVTRSSKDLVGTVIGVYALGVATSIYMSLAG